MKYLAGFLAAVVLAVAGALGVIYGGLYDVAATDPHNDVVYWGLHGTLHQSVERQAADIPEPELSAEEAEAGFSAFDAMCATRYRAPGLPPAEWVRGLRPGPPPLPEAIGRWSAAELFWLLKQGIKMSGMPTFGPSHEDAELWQIVAFLERLPSVSARSTRP